ncbi:MAG: recombination mediator RecR [Oscillospiraceae bacterium]|nr:recombination mediator RecR [Oscillospiraceae bacterium]
MSLPEPLIQLAEQLRLLPGVGSKTALKYAFRILELSDEQAENLLASMNSVRQGIKNCPRCYHISEEDLCVICADDTRDTTTLCVVEDARDVIAFERVKDYRGQYHVLGGTISPMNNISPAQLNIDSLAARIAEGGIREVIIATNPTLEGEATAMYLSKLLTPQGVSVSRLAYGLPAGADLEYADEVTLSRAMSGRKVL